jgi:pyridoxal phosphate enzyme (YggS family)
MQAPVSPEDIATRLENIRSRISAAAIKAGRQAQDVMLVAVSKTHSAASVQAAVRAGQTVFGENRVQEAMDKFPTLRAASPELRLHLIGGLQTNKARDAVRLADVIESLDRPRLADAIAAAMEREGRAPKLRVEVNVGDEPQKAGIARNDADRFIADCQRRFGAGLIGLMCVPPEGQDPAPHFSWLAQRAQTHGLATVSMGMSADFELAIACGATWVRVGSAIFGSRAAGGNFSNPPTAA